MSELPIRKRFYGIGGLVLLLVSGVFSLGISFRAEAAINQQITFYGSLEDSSGNALSGTYDMVFRFYDAASGGTLLDTSTHTSGNGNPVTVSDGEFSVLLGSGSGNALDGVDFNTASIYVGLSVAGDPEMTPRERLSAAPYAFNADRVDGLQASSFAQLGGTATFTAATATQAVVTTNFSLSGTLTDTTDSVGTSGYVLQTTGSGVQWVSTSSLNIAGTNPFGASIDESELNITGSPTNGYVLAASSTAAGGFAWYATSSAYLNLASGGSSVSFGADNQIPFMNTGGTDYEYSADLTFDGTDLSVGAAVGYAIDTNRILFAEPGNDSIYLGNGTGGSYGGASNTFLGELAAGNRASGDYNTFIGAYAGQFLATSSDAVLIGGGAGNGNGTPAEANGLTIVGTDAGYDLQTGANNNTFVGNRAGTNVTIGANNILLGYQAGDGLTTGANNIVLGYDVEAPSNTGSNQLNIGNLIFGSGVDGTGTTLSSGNVGIGTSTPSSKLSVDGDVFITGALYDNASSSGTSGSVLQSTGAGFAWVATSSLGLSSSTRFTELNDVSFSSLTAELIPYTNAAGTALTQNTAFRFDGSNLGVGTVNPVETLHVGGGNILLDNTQTIRWRNSGAVIQTMMAYDSGNTLQIGSEVQNETRIFATNGITLNIGSTEYVRVDSSGDVGILNNNPLVALHIGSTTVTDSTSLLRLEDTNSTCNFTADGGGPTCGSDERLKQDIAAIEGELSLITALDPKLYRWKTESAADPLQSGFIAQEVEQILPELVTDNVWIDGTTKKFLNTGGMMPYVVGAIGEQQHALGELLRTGSTSVATALYAELQDGTEDTVWERLVRLADSFIGGVLSVAGIETTYVYTKDLEADSVTTDELCLGGTCVTETELVDLLERKEAETTATSDTPVEPTNDDTVEAEEENEVDTEESTEEASAANEVTDESVDDENTESEQTNSPESEIATETGTDVTVSTDESSSDPDSEAEEVTETDGVAGASNPSEALDESPGTAVESEDTETATADPLEGEESESVPPADDELDSAVETETDTTPEGQPAGDAEQGSDEGAVNESVTETDDETAGT